MELDADVALPSSYGASILPAPCKPAVQLAHFDDTKCRMIMNMNVISSIHLYNIRTRRRRSKERNKTKTLAPDMH